MPLSCPDRSSALAPRPADGLSRRLWITAAAALLCLLVAGNASASIQGRHVAARMGHAVAQSHCLPAAPHADPFASELPLAAVLSGGRLFGSKAVAPLRALRAPGDGGLAGGDGAWASPEDPRTAMTLPSYWGATHLSV